MQRPSTPRRPFILFLNRFFSTFPETGALPCRDVCEFSTDPARLADADAVVIHVPTFRRPHAVRKYPGQLWVAWYMESKANYPQLADRNFMRHFDLRMSYERDADVWHSYLPPSAQFDAALQLPLPPKSGGAPAAMFQSSGSDHSGRTAFCAELMRYMRVDSYGKVLNNRPAVVPDVGLATKLATIARYKFTIAFENSIERDYVTEKFYQPLMAGSVPVYLGAPNVDDYAPGEHCFVNTADFAGPAALARYLNHLDTDDAAYGAYHAWRRRDLHPQFRRDLALKDDPPLCRLAHLIAAREPSRGRGWPKRPFGRLAVLRDLLLRR